MSCPNHDATKRNPACHECNPVRVDYVHPPIPLRTHDYSAVRDSYDGAVDSRDLIGYGKTAAEAIASLYEQEAEADPNVCPSCGTEGYLDSDDTCRSPACESSRADTAESLMGDR